MTAQPNVVPHAFPFQGSVAQSAPDQQVWANINKINLDRVAAKLRLEMQWGENQIESAIEGYRVYLFLSYRAHQEGKTVVPFKMVDEVWHRHILKSVQQYVDDVTGALGFMLDHIAHLPDENNADSANSVLMGDYLKTAYVPMAVHNCQHAGCDGHATCEFDDGQ